MGMNKNNPHDLKVGQRLWFVRGVNRSRYGVNDYFVEITKIGRKWATVAKVNDDDTLFSKTNRICLQSLWMDGGDYISHGKCYVSKADYQAKEHLCKCWDALGIYQRYSKPDGLTLSTIEIIAKEIGVDLPEMEIE